ncbi:MAG: hypothetical protein K9J30_14590 [Bacteroidales bacterium]|nr:hypothetical protein [Bacteroidales bacterium]
MWKRLLTGSLIAVVIAVVLYFFVLDDKESFHSISAAEAVPSNVILFVDNIDYEYFRDDFFTTNLLWQELLKYSYYAGLDSSVGNINNIIEKLSLLQDGIGKDALSISLHMIGNKKIVPLFLLELKGNVSFANIEEEMNGLLGRENAFSQRKYEGVNINEVTIDGNRGLEKLFYTIKDGILMIASIDILLEESIRSIDTKGGIYSHKGFREVASTAGKYVQGNLYVNYSRLNQLFDPIFKNQAGIRSELLSRMATWGEFDIDIDDEMVVLNGMTYADDSTSTWLNLFKDQDPVRLEVTSYIPSGVTEFLSVGISNTETFRKRFYDHLKYAGEYQVFKRTDGILKDKLGESPLNTLLNLLGNEIVWFVIDPLNNGSPEEVVVYELNSRSEAKDKLGNWAGLLVGSDQGQVDQNISQYRLDDQTIYSIYAMNQKLYDQLVLDKFIKSYFAFYDNYLIFSDSKDAIKRTIYQNVLHKTLINESYFEPVSNLMSSKMNLIFFIRPEPYMSLNGHNFNDGVLTDLNEWLPTLRKTAGIVIQYSSEDDIFYSNLSVDFSSGVRENALTVWESLLDSIVIAKPSLVVNHNTGDREILVQDAGNTLYLLNSTGRILWKLRLKGPVLSEFFQIDYYSNGKLQYLFNTSEALHLIDRNGNYVERYPVRFRANATNGMALFDYDKRQEYRIFVACEDRKVYCYDIQGNMVTGWGFDKTEGTVVNPVQHFRIRDKDYIVFDDEKRVYMMNRRGKERVHMKDPVKTSKKNQFYFNMDLEKDTPQLVTTDPQGNVIGIYFDGNQRRMLENEASEDHLFISTDLDQDGKSEYIFSDENEIEVIESNGKRLFSFKIKSDISTLPDVYQFSSSELKIGITDKETNNIYLLNSDGTLYEGFPLKGNSRFSIGYFAGSDSRFNLIVGSRNSFLYNYSIE